MTYAEAMARYGTDKPDLRFGVELVELTDHFAGTEFRVFQAPYVGAVVMPGGAAQSRKQFDAWQEWAQVPRRARAGVRDRGRGRLARGPVAKNLSEPSTRRAGRGGRRGARGRGVLRRRRAGRTRRRCSARSGSRSAAAAG